MEKTKILCPDCMKDKIVTADSKNGMCNYCGTTYIITGPMTVRYN